MYLLAEASESNPVATIILIVFMLIGLRNICTFLGGNKIARDTAKRGVLAILWSLFKK